MTGIRSFVKFKSPFQIYCTNNITLSYYGNLVKNCPTSCVKHLPVEIVLITFIFCGTKSIRQSSKGWRRFESLIPQLVRFFKSELQSQNEALSKFIEDILVLENDAENENEKLNYQEGPKVWEITDDLDDEKFVVIVFFY